MLPVGCTANPTYSNRLRLAKISIFTQRSGFIDKMVTEIQGPGHMIIQWSMVVGVSVRLIDLVSSIPQGQDR